MRNINEPALETKATAVISHHFTCCVNYQGWKLKYHAAFQDANEWDGIISSTLAYLNQWSQLKANAEYMALKDFWEDDDDNDEEEG